MCRSTTPEASTPNIRAPPPAIRFRYADVLLNYAEALAELNGAANAQTIVEALHPLRARVGMPDVDFDREFNSDPAYPFAHLDKYIRAVRRERRIEKSLRGPSIRGYPPLGSRRRDLRGQMASGALFTGSSLENEPAYATLKYDQPSGNTIFLSGNPGDPYRYIIPTNPRATRPDGSLIPSATISSRFRNA